jgi:hypothetical protein
VNPGSTISKDKKINPIEGKINKAMVEEING